MTKYIIKFIKEVYNFDAGYPLLGISLKEVIREVYKYLASERLILTLLVMTKIGNNIFNNR